MKKKIVGLLCAVNLFSCSSPECYPEFGQPNYTNYPVQFVNKQGILVDDPMGELDLEVLKHKILAVSECVSRIQTLPPDGQCIAPRSELKQCLIIKVAPEWHISQCSGEQVFSCNVPFESCAMKGQTPNTSCPCSCRAIIQDNGVIITTPNLKLVPAQLTSLLTGCYYPWVGELANCANPNI